jgi:hypothetical protein
MTENTTSPLNVKEHVEPRQPAVGVGSQAQEGIGLTTAKKKKKKMKKLGKRRMQWGKH